MLLSFSHNNQNFNLNYTIFPFIEKYLNFSDVHGLKHLIEFFLTFFMLYFFHANLFLYPLICAEGLNYFLKFSSSDCYEKVMQNHLNLPLFQLYSLDVSIKK